MTHRKITVCRFINGISPEAKEARHRDRRPKFCIESGCLGLLADCEHRSVEKIHDRKEIAEMISYLRKLKKKTEE
jgi:hypothetical protein